jgi:hypothetical protein
MHRVGKQTISFLLGGLVFTAIFLAGQLGVPDSGPRGGAQVVYAQTEILAPESQGANPTLNFQGQLLNPATGQPVANGAYAMTFSLYNAASGGAPLWSEVQQLAVTEGLFVALLGSVTPLDRNIFNGQQLYLGIRVGGDPEAAPRQPVGYAAYAIYADRTGSVNNAANADRLDGLDSTDFVRLGNDGVVAYGVVDSDGSRIDGVRFSSTRAGDGVYEISIDGESYNLNSFVTVVTIVDNNDCLGPQIAKTGSRGGRLNIYLFNLSNQLVACKFHFVTFEP